MALSLLDVDVDEIASSRLQNNAQGLKCAPLGINMHAFPPRCTVLYLDKCTLGNGVALKNSARYIRLKSNDVLYPAGLNPTCSDHAEEME